MTSITSVCGTKLQKYEMGYTAKEEIGYILSHYEKHILIVIFDHYFCNDGYTSGLH